MFTNACEGVKKIRRAEILALAATILLLIGRVISVFGLRAGGTTSSGEGLPAGNLAVIAAGILLIVGAVMNIVGVSRASRDEPVFRNALTALLFGIAANILVSAFSYDPVINSIGKTAVNITEILASYCICTGIINLADRLGNSSVSARGEEVRSILMGIWMTAAVVNILGTLFGTNETMQNAIGIIAIVGGIISIIACFFYIGLLGQAKKMLE